VKPPIDQERYNVWDELDNFVDELTILMNKCQVITGNLPNPQKNPVDVTFHPRVIDDIVARARYYDEKLTKPDFSNIDIYQQGHWEHLAKLSMLEAISRGELKELVNEDKTESTVFVTEKDLQRAQKFLDNVSKTNELIAEALVASEGMKTSKKVLDRIYYMIEKAGSMGIDRSTLTRNLNLKTKDFNEYMTTLFSQDRIYTEKKRTGKAGTSTTFYFSTKFKEEDK